ncbi:MAG TPA: SUF system NifU family Fe-S cluster assembly protein, partial [Bacilli bacterium]|nr:SUF system NifU family Fe-S cluster assembly protein [Bacilli bacterium]
KGLKGFPHVHIKNPSCGDDITVEAEIINKQVKQVRHQGSGCSICCSSASVLSELMLNKSVDEARALVSKYYAMIKGEALDHPEALEEAIVYQGVAKFPARIKCATIAWKAFEQILNGETDE